MKYREQPFETITRYAPYLLILAPILIHGSFWSIHKTYWNNTDPSTWYFLDSLSIFAGRSYTFIDHPGTPVQLLGSLFLALSIPFVGSGQDLVNYHLAKPEVFFSMANLFLAGINSLTTVLLYRLATKLIKVNPILAGIAVSLTYFAIHPLSSRMLTYWQHNAFYFSFGTLWWVLVYGSVIQEKFSHNNKFVAGLAAGVLANIQVFLTPLLISSVLLAFLYEQQRFKSFKKGLVGAGYALLGNLAGVTIMLLPIYRELPRFWNWISGIIFSESLYGDGREGFFTLEALLQALHRWPKDNYLLVLFGALLLAGCLVGLYFRWKENLQPSTSLTILFTVSVVQALLLILLITRGYARPRYSLALAALLPVCFLAILQLIDLAKHNLVRIRQIIFVLIIASAFFNTYTELGEQYNDHILERDLAISRSIAIKSYARQYNLPEDDVVIVYAYGTPIKCASLVLANDWLALFDQEISALCPNQYAFYTDGASVNLNSNRKLTDVRNIDWDMVISSGEPTFLSLLDVEKIKYAPGAWGIPKRYWFFVQKGAR